MAEKGKVIKSQLLLWSWFSWQGRLLFTLYQKARMPFRKVLVMSNGALKGPGWICGRACRASSQKSVAKEGDLVDKKPDRGQD